MGRFKGIIGSKLRSRNFNSQKVEINLGCGIHEYHDKVRESITSCTINRLITKDSERILPSFYSCNIATQYQSCAARWSTIAVTIE
ncbi:MAG: hypothetical protein ACI8P9_003740 [Parasphingorhabdus sp.]|jgi:hypothetical protein